MSDLQNRLAISGESIQELYNWYNNRTLIINRKYQRKLVWTANEKEKLIDTIKKDFPIPLFLLAELENGKNEIIDGMQRFSSIFHFIENKFSLDGKYFDLETLATTKHLKDKGEILQQTPILDRETCSQISNYKLAISIYKKKEDILINDIFNRINSYGKKLSRQESRQVGSVDDFPTLVRIVSEKIRGDISHSDILELNKMQNISIDIEDGTNNSIKASSIYWCKQGILTKNDIRDGEDEALVANILSSILTNIRYRIANDELDYYYGKSQTSNKGDVKKALERKNELVSCLNNYTLEKLEKDFFLIFDLIKSLNIRVPSKRNFIVLFLSLYELYIKENKEIEDESLFKEKIFFALNKIETTQGGVWSKENVVASVTIVNSLLTKTMKISKKQIINNEKITEIENLLSISTSESIYYDIKQGFHSLDNENKFNKEVFTKIMNTICAISNNGKNETGTIIIGVSDTEKDKDRGEDIYNSKDSSKKINNFYITGLNGESNNYNSFENYYKYICDLFEEEKKKFKNLGNVLIDSADYYDRNLLLIKIKSSNKICIYNDKIFQRVGPQTIEVNPIQVVSIMDRFND